MAQNLPNTTIKNLIIHQFYKSQSRNLPTSLNGYLSSGLPLLNNLNPTEKD